MTCKKCKWEFCWVCMGPWSEHGTSWYQCNRFDEKSGTDNRDVQAKSRASLERYLHVSWVWVCFDFLPVRAEYRSTSIGGRIMSTRPSSMRTFTVKPKRRWKRCRIAATCLGSRYNSPSRLWIRSSERELRSSGRIAWLFSASNALCFFPSIEC